MAQEPKGPGHSELRLSSPSPEAFTAASTASRSSAGPSAGPSTLFPLLCLESLLYAHFAQLCSHSPVNHLHVHPDREIIHHCRSSDLYSEKRPQLSFYYSVTTLTLDVNSDFIEDLTL